MEIWTGTITEQNRNSAGGHTSSSHRNAMSDEFVKNGTDVKLKKRPARPQS